MLPTLGWEERPVVATNRPAKPLFLETNTRAATIFRDELNSGGFQGESNGF